MGHSLTSDTVSHPGARACSLAKIYFSPHGTRGPYSQGSRVGTKIMITTSCLRLRSGGSPIRAGPPEDPLRLASVIAIQGFILPQSRDGRPLSLRGRGRGAGSGRLPPGPPRRLTRISVAVSESRESKRCLGPVLSPPFPMYMSAVEVGIVLSSFLFHQLIFRALPGRNDDACRAKSCYLSHIHCTVTICSCVGYWISNPVQLNSPEYMVNGPSGALSEWMRFTVGCLLMFILAILL